MKKTPGGEFDRYIPQKMDPTNIPIFLLDGHKKIPINSFPAVFLWVKSSFCPAHRLPSQGRLAAQVDPEDPEPADLDPHGMLHQFLD